MLLFAGVNVKDISHIAFAKNSCVIKSSLTYTILLFGCYLLGIPETIGQSTQQDTSYTIPTVLVTTSKYRQRTTGSVSQDWNTEQLNKLPINNVADLLGQEAGLYIKSYGQGSLATSSVRGGSAGHTLVLWNGLPVHSPMLGLLDLSLLPAQFSESINFTLGGNSAMWGSGAIGGVLNLKNQARFSKKTTARSDTQIGSFGLFKQHISLGVGNGKIQSLTKIAHQQSKNDFYYFLADGIPERQQTNAKLNQQNIGQDLYWKINNQHQLAFHFWWQKSDRQIPPTNVQNRSEAHQDDQSTRLALEYKLTKKNGLWNFKTGFFNEQLDYFDDLSLEESLSNFKTYFAEITRQWSWRNNHAFLIGNAYTYTQVWTADYTLNYPTEFKKALFASWKFRRKNLQTQVGLRQELVNQTLMPIVPSFGFDYKISSSIFASGKFSRNFRNPTFNDRFWIRGGNPDLLPESGWSQELTLKYRIQKNRLSFNTSLTAFNRNIDNWIYWTKQEGQSFWSAKNITKVWSRGLEPRIQMQYNEKDLTLQIRGGYNYILSTNQVALQNPKLAVGDQLFYTPIHQAFGSISTTFKNFSCAYQHTFNGATNGINDILNPYQVGNVRLQYLGGIKDFSGTLFFNINNIWDANYLVVERRPMPGIHFETGLNLIFEKNKK